MNYKPKEATEVKIQHVEGIFSAMNLQIDKLMIERLISEAGGIPTEADIDAAVRSRNVRKKKIKAIHGENNILVMAPHGVHSDDSYTNIIAEEMANNFGCYAIINDRYYKSKPSRKKKTYFSRSLADLYLIKNLKMKKGEDFSREFEKYTNEIH